MRKKIITIIIIITFVLTPLIYLTVIFRQPMFSATFLEPSSTIAEFTDQLESNWEDILKSYGVVGGAISLISDNNTSTIVGGKANYWRRTPLEIDNYFQIASISKTQCAFAILKLVQEGIVQLDVPVETYLTRWSLPETEFDNDEVTIRRILCHAAGLSVSGVPGNLKLNNVPPIEEALTYADVKVIIEPGTKYMYSGGGYGILQLVIEEVTGKTYEEYMQTEIFEPLGLNETRVQWNAEVDERLAKGHSNFYFPTILSYTPFKAAASHYSTITDMTRWCEIFLYGQTILNSSLENLLLTTQFGEDWGYTLGFSWEKMENGNLIFGHGGDNWGYHSTFRFSNSTGDGIVILTNGDRGVGLIDRLLNEWKKIVGDEDYRDFFDKKRTNAIQIDIITAVCIMLLIVGVTIGIKTGKMSISLEKHEENHGSKKKSMIAIRWMISSIFSFILIFLVILWGWLYNRNSSESILIIWSKLLVIMLISVIIPASQYISFNFTRKTKKNNF